MNLERDFKIKNAKESPARSLGEQMKISFEVVQKFTDGVAHLLEDPDFFDKEKDEMREIFFSYFMPKNLPSPFGQESDLDDYRESITAAFNRLVDIRDKTGQLAVGDRDIVEEKVADRYVSFRVERESGKNLESSVAKTIKDILKVSKIEVKKMYVRVVTPSLGLRDIDIALKEKTEDSPTYTVGSFMMIDGVPYVFIDEDNLSTGTEVHELRHLIHRVAGLEESWDEDRDIADEILARVDQGQGIAKINDMMTTKDNNGEYIYCSHYADLDYRDEAVQAAMTTLGKFWPLSSGEVSYLMLFGIRNWARALGMYRYKKQREQREIG